MKHHIDPKVDCVFKAILGSETNRNLLVHFLNAVLCGELEEPIHEVEILNPYNDQEYLDDKLSIVDVKARDQHGRLYQVEIQLLTRKHLPARILYNWADIYCQQLHSGDNYGKLCPTYSIWLLAENLVLVPTDSDYVHDYQWRDRHGQRLIAHGGIWLLELSKFTAQQIASEQQRWLKFFQDAEQLDLNAAQQPKWMHTVEMRQAMETLKRFSEKERAYHAYQARQNYIREQLSIEEEMEEARRNLEIERQLTEAEKTRAEAEKQRAEAEKHRAETEKHRAETEKQRAEAEKQRAEAEKHRAETEKTRAEAAEQEIIRLTALLAKHSLPHLST